MNVTLSTSTRNFPHKVNKVKVKLKLSQYMPGQALMAPGG